MRIPSWGYLALGAAGAIAIMVAPLSLFGPPHLPIYRDPVRLVVMSIMAGLAMGWNLVFAWLAFRRLDEYAQAASKFAWYWGGSIGLAASLPIFAFIAWGGVHWLMPSAPVGDDLFRALALGYLLPVFGQFLGFAVAHVYWRMSKR